ncbi:three-helix bundle dimerization domain-containing protein [Mycobacterium sp.]|uniref:three-helix bundle dimerization domain-containing protein n=1 Tax=Mycobacterium sp. TaxID=1785 RepID=UPI003F966710
MIERKKSERTAIQEVIERLTHKHLDLSPQTIADVVQKMHTKFDGRPVRDFVPLFVERNAHAELTKLNA